MRHTCTYLVKAQVCTENLNLPLENAETIEQPFSIYMYALHTSNKIARGPTLSEISYTLLPKITEIKI